jgi:hypothetical protein
MAKLKIKNPITGKCCCGAGTCAIFCSTRGGTATLCGIPEFLVPASVPPKKYRKMTPSGQTYICYRVNPDCSGDVLTVDSYDFDAADVIEFGATDCAQTPSSPTYTHYVNSGISLSCGYSTAGTPTVESEPIGSQGPSSTLTANSTISRTLTSWESTGLGSGACNASGTLYYNLFGNNRQELSIEDTEASAISRIPGIGTWSSYISCSSLVGECCRTAWQMRGAGQFDFEYVESRIKVQGGTTSPSQHVNVKVELWRRAYGVGVYALYQTLEDDVISGLDSFFSVDFGVVNNTIGFETVCRNCSVEAL